MSDEKPVPWDDNTNAQIVLSRLKNGPASTIELQSPPIVHVARQIWELRHWYDWRIKTGRLPNGVALYTLVGRAETVGSVVARPRPAVSPRPTFGDASLIRELRRTKRQRVGLVLR
jgi:hypothetical protein